MPQVQHPRLPEVTQEVPAKDVRRWKAQGWLVVDEKKDSASK
jgi:hypothetical protein